MARKNNIRSMRFSDDVIEMIESQQGRNFSEKFENLVTRCMWELPEKEKELERLDEFISRRRDEIGRLGDKYFNLQRTLRFAEEYAGDIAKFLFAEQNNKL